jgi:glycosyltransferase involved in cell wall biosynthesis
MVNKSPKHLKKPDSILFINQSSGYLMIDIVNAFREKYEKRILMTGTLNKRNKNLDGDVTVIKMKTYNRSNVINRSLSWIIGFFQALYIVIFHYRSSHLFLVSNPPFLPLLPLFCKNPFDLLVYDIYPDIIVEKGYAPPNAFYINQWKKANIKVFNKAENIYTLTDGMKEVLGRYTKDSRIKVIPVWTDNDFLKPLPKKENIFLKSNNLFDQFIVLYSGNLGASHNAEIIIELASKIKLNQIKFIIVGQGANKQRIEKLIEKKKLSNCHVFPWQSNETFPYVLASADISIVSLDEKASNLAIPSKFYNYLSVGSPILCISDKRSDLAKMVSKYEVGECFEHQEIDEMCGFIENLYKFPDQRQMFHKNSLKTSTIFNPENAKLFV